MADDLTGKKILIVDDEPDVLDMLSDLLSQCIIDRSLTFDNAEQLLARNDYDAAILDIMGVNGYDLLELCRQRGIPAIMLTAHALSPGNLMDTVKKGACAYIPKDDMIHMDSHLSNVIAGSSDNNKASEPDSWFEKLAPIFDRKFGPDWRIKNKAFLEEFNLGHSRDEVAGLS